TEFMMHGTPRACMLQIRPDWGNVPPNWMPYVAVADCDAGARKAASLGGKVIRAPTDIPNVGRFAVLGDPQGAVFAIIKLSAPALKKGLFTTETRRTRRLTEETQ